VEPKSPRIRGYVAVALAALAVAAVVVAAARPTLGDYTHVAPRNADNAAPAIDAVLRDDLGRVPAVQPVMGPVSVGLRLPFAAVGRAIGGRQLEYWLGCVACLWALAALAIVLALRVRRRDGGGLAAPAAVVLVLVANPLTLAALDAGHPEELLAGALACAALMAAGGGRSRLTGLLLGLAVATKPWAVLAAPLVFALLPRGRRVAPLALAGGLAAALVAPLALADPHRLFGGSHELGESMRVYPASAWWPFAHHVAARAWSMPLGLTRSAGQMLAAAVAVAAGFAATRGGRGPSVERALALLAAVMLARCLLDPLNLAYYALPFMLALVAWETATRRGLPVIALGTSVLAWATTLHPASNAALACGLYLAWSLPLTAVLFAPRLVARRPSASATA
jgi:hypothetical protein